MARLRGSLPCVHIAMEPCACCVLVQVVLIIHIAQRPKIQVATRSPQRAK